MLNLLSNTELVASIWIAVGIYIALHALPLMTFTWLLFNDLLRNSHQKLLIKKTSRKCTTDLAKRFAVRLSILIDTAEKQIKQDKKLLAFAPTSLL
jgi:flagellar basal body-associated protein FliL